MAGEAWFDMTDMPTDFDSLTSAEVEVRWRAQGHFGAYPGTKRLYARIYQSDETTALTDEIEVVSSAAATDWANSALIPFTGEVAGDKTIWDGARIRFRWD